MIPKIPLTIASRHATIKHAQLATEKHGKKKVGGLIDLKFVVLMDSHDINGMLRMEETAGVDYYQIIYDQSGDFRVPGIEMKGEIRLNLKGELQLKVEGVAKPLKFQDAHLVGTVSQLKFKVGGQAELTLQLRIAAGKYLERLAELPVIGDCLLEFAEYADNPAKADKTQAELTV